MKKIVVFDFDGVICNSTEECMITGYNAWLKYNKKNNFIRSSEEVPSDLAQYFRPLRSLVRTAGQYFLIFNSYKNGQINTEADFNDYCRKCEDEISEYEKLFFQSRDILRDQDVTYWLNLLYSYEDFSENMKKVIIKTDVYIVTGKDKDSVRTFLLHAGIDFQASRIYDKDAAHNKVGALKEIAQRENRALAEIVFLDDNINHLLEPKEAGCLVYLAGWGYHLQEHLQKAVYNKIEILNLKDWCDIIMNEVDK